MRSKPKYLGIDLARRLLKGDVGAVRRELRERGPMSWRVCEIRALAGACREVNRRWGTRLTVFNLCW